MPFISQKRLNDHVRNANKSARMWHLVSRRYLADKQDLIRQRDALAGERARIKGVLAEVAVYEGMDVGDDLLRYVAELVRDHEELEARIDAVLSNLFGIDTVEWTPTEFEIARLLRGGSRFPDTPAGILDDGLPDQ